MPRPFGQHFLRSEPAHDLVDLIDPQPEDTFLEIGPGALAITSLLARRCKAVVAIEIDLLYSTAGKSMRDQRSVTGRWIPLETHHACYVMGHKFRQSVENHDSGQFGFQRP